MPTFSLVCRNRASTTVSWLFFGNEGESAGHRPTAYRDAAHRLSLYRIIYIRISDIIYVRHPPVGRCPMASATMIMPDTTKLRVNGTWWHSILPVGPYLGHTGPVVFTHARAAAVCALRRRWASRACRCARARFLALVLRRIRPVRAPRVQHNATPEPCLRALPFPAKSASPERPDFCGFRGFAIRPALEVH